MKPLISGVTYETHSEEIRRAAYKKLVNCSNDLMRRLDLGGSNLWYLDEIKRELELNMLAFLVANNQIPIGPAILWFEARIEQRAVSDEILYATKGKRIAVPRTEHHILWEKPVFEFDLPLTEAEKNYKDD